MKSFPKTTLSLPKLQCLLSRWKSPLNATILSRQKLQCLLGRWIMKSKRRQPYRCRVRLHCPSGFLPQLFSVVFVHGPVDRLEAWTAERGICWPRDFLPKERALSNVRILSFGYDAKSGGRAFLSNLSNHSENLLTCLCKERSDNVGFVSVSSLMQVQS